MIKRNEQQGLVHIYTGTGKGKTTAALGLALRAISYQKKVLLVQFIKGPWRSGELRITDRLKPYLTIKALGKGFVKILGDTKPFQEHQKAAQQALRFAERAIQSAGYHMVVLDEVNVAIREKLITTDQVVQIIKKKPHHVELVLTGRNAPQRLIQIADYVSEIQEVKHPYQKGILARRSIDY